MSEMKKLECREASFNYSPETAYEKMACLLGTHVQGIRLVVK